MCLDGPKKLHGSPTVVFEKGSHAADHIRFHVELCEEGSFKRVFIFA